MQRQTFVPEREAVLSRLFRYFRRPRSAEAGMAGPAPITLTTDFGQQDRYVGQMKGAILRIAPTAPIVDITHAIRPQDVRAASFVIADLAEAFPPNTVHLGVIDPGVGSSRRVIATRVGDQFYVAPDNGLLTLVLARDPEAPIVEIPQQAGENRAISATFHGRDIMAPVAARLARDQSLAALGKPLVGEPIRLSGLEPRHSSRDAGRIEGIIASVDHFGNLITNIPLAVLASSDTPAPSVIAAFCGPFSVHGLRRYYSEVPEGKVLLLVGSSGNLEVAVNGGSAAALWNASAGDAIVIASHNPEPTGKRPTN